MSKMFWDMIKECPAFLYRYNPSQKAGDTRYVFKDKTFTGRSAYSDAYWYAYDLKFQAQALNEKRFRE